LGLPFFIVTHRREEEPDGGEFTPVVLGGGKRLFEGFSRPLDLEHLGVRQSAFATFIEYAVKRS
jgi:hypothetical protein